MAKRARFLGHSYQALKKGCSDSGYQLEDSGTRVPRLFKDCLRRCEAHQMCGAIAFYEVLGYTVDGSIKLFPVHDGSRLVSRGFCHMVSRHAHTNARRCIRTRHAHERAPLHTNARNPHG